MTMARRGARATRCAIRCVTALSVVLTVIGETRAAETVVPLVSNLPWPGACKSNPVTNG